MADDRLRSLVLIGAPGSGKGTQGKLVGCVPGFRHFSTGDMFRSLDPQTELGRTFRSYSTRGELVPDDVTISVWKQYIDAQVTLGLYRPHSELLLLDGLPRSEAQARLIDRHIEVLGIIHLVVRDIEAMVKRLKGRALKEGRTDDAREDVIRRRHDVYERETAPVLKHYAADLIHEIDAQDTIPNVLAGVMSVAAPIHQRVFADGSA